MTDIVYKYPLSSCQCYECSKKEYPKVQGVPTNMSVRSCQTSDFYDCYDRSNFKIQNEPQQKEGRYPLNSQSMANYATDFYPVECKTNQLGNCGGKKLWTSADPRLWNAPLAQRLLLDQPPQDDNVKLNEIYDEKYRGFGENYKSYADVSAGQISYYIDRSREDAFYGPNFSTTARTVGTLYQDPMSNMKPQYERVPLISRNYLNTERQNYPDGLSSLTDSTFHREDLMARQMRKQNEQRYAPRWTGNITQ